MTVKRDFGPKIVPATEHLLDYWLFTGGGKAQREELGVGVWGYTRQGDNHSIAEGCDHKDTDIKCLS